MKRQVKCIVKVDSHLALQLEQTRNRSCVYLRLASSRSLHTRQRSTSPSLLSSFLSVESVWLLRFVLVSFFR